MCIYLCIYIYNLYPNWLPNDIVLRSIHPRCVDTSPTRFLQAAASQLPSPDVRFYCSLFLWGCCVYSISYRYTVCEYRYTVCVYLYLYVYVYIYNYIYKYIYI